MLSPYSMVKDKAHMYRYMLKCYHYLLVSLVAETILAWRLELIQSLHFPADFC